MVDIKLLGEPVERDADILTPDALAFVAGLHHAFADRRDELLRARVLKRERASREGKLDFLPETREIRESDWRVAPAPPALTDRRVEITGPTDAKMAINALNSGARVWLADLEDANTPHWRNVVSGQVSLLDAARGRLEFTSPEGKHYAVTAERPATIVVRPRGWHLDEKHVLFDGRRAIGALVDFGLHFFHNARVAGPYYYLPKMESHLEARLWNDVFTHAERELGIAHGSVRATVLIETIPAAFEMDEILYELREHASGLNAGRWDYLFSLIKYFRDAGPEFVLPDRDAVTMTAPFMRAYTELLVRTCHRRGAFAMGGMAAFIPNRRDPDVTARALEKVREDKGREAGDGFDGSWVAHPDLVPVCREVFDAALGDRPNQLDRLREDVSVSAADLLAVSATPGRATMAGLRSAIDIGVRYLESWLAGTGAAAIHNLMEDAATAEISRSLVWQWVRNKVVLDTGDQVSADLVWAILAEQPLTAAVELFADVALAPEYVDFLTVPAYERI
ncbi:malate synthase A [Actinokineospora xionganensis]|uniref:Malate synthase n=1 Tax=Actinokineospora xionganensis TaxID=2684470 RepID=A0ABR7LEB0_9PSEU|nr:malate synthase A [Actinokineospora xionganensis]MBC6450739.1 malate synthase A [Actinokineospora xionganensis]